MERLSSDRQPLVEAALCAISNVSDNPEARVELVTRGLPTLLTLCAHDASAIHLQASWLLCLLAASAESSKTLLADAAALPAMFAHARRPSDSAQEEAAWALATLSADTQTSRQVGLADGACTSIAPAGKAYLTLIAGGPSGALGDCRSDRGTNDIWACAKDGNGVDWRHGGSCGALDRIVGDAGTSTAGFSWADHMNELGGMRSDGSSGRADSRAPTAAGTADDPGKTDDEYTDDDE